MHFIFAFTVCINGLDLNDDDGTNLLQTGVLQRDQWLGGIENKDWKFQSSGAGLPANIPNYWQKDSFENFLNSSQRTDTLNWKNPQGLNCSYYEHYCLNGMYRPGYAWTGSPLEGAGSKCESYMTATKTNCAMAMNYPEDNCMACGKGRTGPAGTLTTVPVDTPGWKGWGGRTCLSFRSWTKHGRWRNDVSTAASPFLGVGSNCEPRLTDKLTNCAMVENYPEDNCVVCGKGTRTAADKGETTTTTTTTTPTFVQPAGTTPTTTIPGGNTNVGGKDCFGAITTFGPDFECNAEVSSFCGDDSADGLDVSSCCQDYCNSNQEKRAKNKDAEADKKKAEGERKSNRQEGRSKRKDAESSRKKKRTEEEWLAKRSAQETSNKKEEDERKTKRGYSESKRKNERSWKANRAKAKKAAQLREVARKAGRAESAKKNANSGSESSNKVKLAEKKKKAGQAESRKKNTNSGSESSNKVKLAEKTQKKKAARKAKKEKRQKGRR